MTSRVDNVKAWAEIISIPTYGIGQPDKNPLFLRSAFTRVAAAWCIPIRLSTAYLTKI